SSSVVGPGWGSLYGSTARLTDGSSIEVDDDYLSASIRRPDEHIAAGYAAGTMPSYDSLLDDDQVEQHRGRRRLPVRVDPQAGRAHRGRLRGGHHAELRQPARRRPGRGDRRLHPHAVGRRTMIQIQYETQRLSMRFFMLMLV